MIEKESTLNFLIGALSFTDEGSSWLPKHLNKCQFWLVCNKWHMETLPSHSVRCFWQRFWCWEPSGFWQQWSISPFKSLHILTWPLQAVKSRSNVRSICSWQTHHGTALCVGMHVFHTEGQGRWITLGDWTWPCLSPFPCPTCVLVQNGCFHLGNITFRPRLEVTATYIYILCVQGDLDAHRHRTPQLCTGDDQYSGPMQVACHCNGFFYAECV